MQNHTIVDRVVERLKAQPLGDLITEEDLHEIVKQAVPKAFFEEHRDPKYTGYGAAPIIEPQIVVIMRELLRDTAKDAVAKYLADNPQIIADYWKQVCDKGLIEYVQNVMSAKATDAVRSGLQPWIDMMNRERSAAGLPSLGVYFRGYHEGS